MSVDDATDPRSFFTRHRDAYVTSPRHALGEDLFRLVDGLRWSRVRTALDVATGAGHTAVLLARRGLAVTVVDVTPAMLAAAVELGRVQGVTLTAIEARAEALPFAGGTFDVVTSRRAAHHFTDLDAFLREAARVLVPGGQLAVSDMTASGPSVAWLNEVERLRDPSHRSAKTMEEWRAALARAGFGAVRTEVRQEAMAPEEWCYPVDSKSPEGEAALARVRRSDAPSDLVVRGQFIRWRLLLWAETRGAG